MEEHRLLIGIVIGVLAAMVFLIGLYLFVRPKMTQDTMDRLTGNPELNEHDKNERQNDNKCRCHDRVDQAYCDLYACNMCDGIEIKR